LNSSTCLQKVSPVCCRGAQISTLRGG